MVIRKNAVFYKRLRQTRRAYPAGQRKLPVYVTEDIASPCLLGIIHPAVYLTPKAVESEDNTRYALTHELCHYCHGDHIWAILRCLCLAVWWWNQIRADGQYSRINNELYERLVKLLQSRC